MRIITDTKLDFSDVLIVPKRSALSSRKDVDLIRTYKFKHSNNSWTGIPIMAANMDGVGTIEMNSVLDQHDMITCLVKSHTVASIEPVKDNFSFGKNIAISTGTSDKDLSNLTDILTLVPKIKFICIDVANGYSEHFGDFVSKIRDKFPDKTIIAGNVVTADMTQELILRGADIIKVGIGPGSVCTTRIQTGVGYPQLSAIIECADAAHGLGGHIIADGGCVSPGDIAKAFGAGADFVMLGGMFAGHDEGGGEIITEIHESNPVSYNPVINAHSKSLEHKKFVHFYGMSSETAQTKNNGGMNNYRSSEGRTVKIMYKGPVEKTIQDILGGLRSTCTYVGATTLKDLSKCTTFIKVNNTHNRVYESHTIGK